MPRMACHSLLRTTLLDLLSLLVCLGCHNRIPQTGWLKQQQFIFSLFWRLEVKIKVSADLVSPGASLLGLQMAMFFLCHHMAFFFSMLVCSWCLFLFLQGYQTYCIRVLPLWPHLTLIILLGGRVSKNSILGVRVSTYEFWGDTIKSKTHLYVYRLNLLPGLWEVRSST